jgi:hypothetical protein
MPSDVRIEVLAQHLGHLGGQLASDAGPAGDACIQNSAATIRLTKNEVSTLTAALDQIDTPDADVEPRLMAETLALILKTTDDTGDFRTAADIDPELEAKVKESLDLDSQAAESLAADIGTLIDRAIEAGDRTTAVRLGDFRLAVRQQVALIRRVLAGEGIDEDQTEDTVEEVSDPLVEPEPSEEDTSDEQLEKSKKRYAKFKRARAKEQRTREQMKRLKILLAFLGVAVVFGSVAFVLQLVPALNPPEVKILTLDDFLDIPIVVSVEAKPPSLFVRINGPHWRRIDRPRRLDVIRAVGRVVAEADYNGARFRDENGDLVGEYIRGVGSYEFPPQSMD